MAKQKSDIKLKMQKDNPEFVAMCDTSLAEDLNAKLAGLAKAAEEVEDAKDADDQLQALRDQAAEAAAPYAETKKAIRAKTRYIIALLRERGSDT